MQMLNHPNIVHFYNCYEDSDHIYIGLEYLQGGELFDRIIQKVTYNENEARNALKCILWGIKHCHDRNIAHRDLKPENLLMTTNEEDADIKICDFGFAAKCTSKHCLEDSCGTPGYVAPEILRQIPHGIAVDMWAIGIIAYTLLAGYSPFYHSNDQKLFRLIVKGHYEFHPDAWSEISEEAKDFIRNLLVQDPDTRFTVDQALAHPWVDPIISLFIYIVVITYYHIDVYRR